MYKNISDNFFNAFSDDVRTFQSKIIFAPSETQYQDYLAGNDNDCVVISSDDFLQSFSIDENIVGTEYLNFGDACYSSIDISVLFNDFSEELISLGNSLKRILKKTILVVPYIGVQIDEEVQQFEYMPLGKFYIEEVTTENNYKTCRIVANDKMASLNDDVSVLENAFSNRWTVGDLLGIIASKYSFELDLNSDIANKSFYLAKIPQEDCTVRTIIGYVAGLFGTNAIFNRDGKLTLKSFERISNVADDIPYYIKYEDIMNLKRSVDEFKVNSLRIGFSITDDDANAVRSVISEDKKSFSLVDESGEVLTDDSGKLCTYTPDLNSTQGSIFSNAIKVIINGIEYNCFVSLAFKGFNIKEIASISVWNTLTYGSNSKEYKFGSGIGIAYSNPYITEQFAKDIWVKINDEENGYNSYLPCEVNWRGNPCIEVGDVVTIEEQDGTLYTVIVMEQTIKYSGGLNVDFKCYGSSVENIEYAQRSLSNALSGTTSSDLIKNSIVTAGQSFQNKTGGKVVLIDTDGDGITDELVASEYKTAGESDNWLTNGRCVRVNHNGIAFSKQGFNGFYDDPDQLDVAISYDNTTNQYIVNADLIRVGHLQGIGINFDRGNIAGWKVEIDGPDKQMRQTTFADGYIYDIILKNDGSNSPNKKALYVNRYSVFDSSILSDATNNPFDSPARPEGIYGVKKEVFFIKRNGYFYVAEGDIGPFNFILDSTNNIDSIAILKGDLDFHKTPSNRFPAICFNGSRIFEPENNAGNTTLGYPHLVYGGMTNIYGTVTQLTGLSNGASSGVVLRVANDDNTQSGTTVRYLKETSGDKRNILRSDTNNGAYLGSASYRWNTVFCTTLNNSSDRKLKKDIVPLSKNEKIKDFLMNLTPVSFKYKDGEGQRVHLGLIAQDVANAANETVGDLSLFQASYIDENGEEQQYQENVDDEKLSWGLNYTELIAPILALVQQQQKEIDNLKKRIELLESKQ